MAKASIGGPIGGNAQPVSISRSLLAPRHSALADTLIALGLALATIATRFPVRSRRAFNWDAVNFVLAMAHYDVRLHRPHPPGYPLFVAMGRVFHLVIPDANGSLVAAAMLLSAGAVAALFWLGKTLSDRATGVVAALYLLCSVTFWANGAVALAYPSLALFSTLVALFAWKLRTEGGMAPARPRGVRRPASVLPQSAVLLSITYALGGGFRPDLLLFLAPLWIWGHWRVGWRQAFAGALVAVGIVVCWAVPMVALSGGIGEYLKVFRAYTATDVLQRYSVAANGPRALLVNLRDTAMYTGYALYALALPVAVAAVWLVGKGVRRQASGVSNLAPGARRSILFFALWIVPMLLFYTWLHIGDPGYVFTFLPALLLLAARGVSALVRPISTVREPLAPGVASRPWGGSETARGGRFANRPYSRVALALTVTMLVLLPLAVNIAVFLTRPRALTAPGIRQQDRTIDGKIVFVRTHGDPATTLLVSYESYRHWLLYLPEYRTQFVDVTYGTEADRTLILPPGVTRVILMDDTLLRAVQGVTPTDTATVERDHVGTLSSPPAPLRFAPVASPLGAPHG